MEHDDTILKIVKVESGKKINWMLNVLKIILDSWYGIRNKHVGRQLSGEREGAGSMQQRDTDQTRNQASAF